jgi:hypothetical protein
VAHASDGFPFSPRFFLRVTLKGSDVWYLWHVKCEGIQWVALRNERAKTKETTQVKVVKIKQIF